MRAAARRRARDPRDHADPAGHKAGWRDTLVGDISAAAVSRTQKRRERRARPPASWCRVAAARPRPLRWCLPRHWRCSRRRAPRNWPSSARASTPPPTPRRSSHGTVLVRDGRIAAVGSAAQVKLPARTPVIDVRGAIVTAGFWNSHVHLLSAAVSPAGEPRGAGTRGRADGVLTRWGFTTVFDIGSLPGDALAVRRRIDSRRIAGPRILTTEAPFFPRDGTPIYLRDLLQALRVPNLEVADAAAGRTRARAQLASGADGVKLDERRDRRRRHRRAADGSRHRARHRRRGARARKLVFAHPSTPRVSRWRSPRASTCWRTRRRPKGRGPTRSRRAWYGAQHRADADADPGRGRTRQGGCAARRRQAHPRDRPAAGRGVRACRRAAAVRHRRRLHRARRHAAANSN